MFKRLYNSIKLHFLIQHEILETLCTICLYIEHDGHFCHNPYSRYMGSHFTELKSLSNRLREEVLKNGSK